MVLAFKRVGRNYHFLQKLLFTVALNHAGEKHFLKVKDVAHDMGTLILRLNIVCKTLKLSKSGFFHGTQRISKATFRKFRAQKMTSWPVMINICYLVPSFSYLSLESAQMARKMASFRRLGLSFSCF